MGKISLGATEIPKIALGSTEIKKVSLGTTEIWTAGAKYIDDFNRANGAIGSNWGPISPQPVINTNAAQNSTTSGNTPQLVEWLGGVMATDHYSVTATIKAPVGTSRVTTTYFYLLARGNGSATQNDDRMVLVMSGAALASGWYTVSSSGAFSNRIAAAYPPSNFVAGDTISLEVDGNIYTAKRNGVTFSTHIDTLGTVPTDASHRGFGFGTQPHNYGLGFAIDSITCTDL